MTLGFSTSIALYDIVVLAYGFLFFLNLLPGYLSPILQITNASR